MAAPITTANVTNALARVHLALSWGRRRSLDADWAHSDHLVVQYPLFGVFLLSFATRLAVAVVFVPGAQRGAPVRRARRVIFRFTRFSWFSGVASISHRMAATRAATPGQDRG